VLPSPSKIKDNGHQPALPYDRIPEFMQDLRAREGVAARALEFLILTSCRPGDIVGQAREGSPPMRWSHVDLVKHTWTIPNTKTGKRHRIPLSAAAMGILDEMRKYGSGDPEDVVFPGARPGQPISGASVGYAIEAMNAGRDGPARYTDPKEGNRDIVPHGFRSSFRDWAAETTNFPREVCEFALGHVVGKKAEVAYWRSDVLRKRQQLAEAWSRHCATPPAAREPGKVVPIRGCG
jgi:integrase